MNKSYNLAVSFILFFVAYIIFWLIVEPSSLKPANFEGIVNMVNGFALFIIPPITAALTFNRKVRTAALTAIILVVAVTAVEQFLPISSEGKGLALFIIPWLLVWDLGAMIVAAILRFIVDKISLPTQNNTDTPTNLTQKQIMPPLLLILFFTIIIGVIYLYFYLR